MKIKKDVLLDCFKTLSLCATNKTENDDHNKISLAGDIAFSNNHEFRVTTKSPVQIHVTFSMKPIVDLIEQSIDDDFDVTSTDDVLTFINKMHEYKIACERQKPQKQRTIESWLPLSTSFLTDLVLASTFVNSQFVGTVIANVFVHDNMIDACDNVKAIRIKTKSKMPSMLLSPSLINVLNTLCVTTYAVDSNVLFFKNKDGVVVQVANSDCTKFPSLTEALKMSDSNVTQIEMPKELIGMLQRAISLLNCDITCYDKPVTIEIKNRKMCVRCSNVVGTLEDKVRMPIDVETSFMINAEHLLKTLKLKCTTLYDEHKLKIMGDHFECVIACIIYK